MQILLWTNYIKIYDRTTPAGLLPSVTSRVVTVVYSGNPYTKHLVTYIPFAAHTPSGWKRKIDSGDLANQCRIYMDGKMPLAGEVGPGNRE